MPRQKKHPSVRQNRARVPGAADLYVLSPEEIKIPDLPPRYTKDGDEIPWKQRTLDWWEAIWSSPMAPEFHQSDIEGLYDLAALKQDFWGGKTYLHAEIRLYEGQFGLNPLARRRLEWQIVDTEDKQDASDAKKAKAARTPSVAEEPDPDAKDPLSA